MPVLIICMFLNLSLNKLIMPGTRVTMKLVYHLRQVTLETLLSTSLNNIFGSTVV